METLQVQDLHDEQSFTGDLFIDSSFLLLPQTANITPQLIDALKKWEFTTVLCDGNISLGGDIGIDTLKHDDSSEQKQEKIGISIKKALEDTKTMKIGNSDELRMKMVTNVFMEYMNYIENIFTHYATHKTIDQDDLSETVQELCVFIKENRRYILRVNPTLENCNKNFLIIHSMRTTVLAIAIALQLHIPLSKMIELGVTCILHEIGMLRLPPQLYMSEKKLTLSERAQMTKHTLFGYKITQELNFPLSIQLGVLEHHEKENGTGYPRALTGEKISSHAKIISVACSYEAISSSRKYKEGRSTFDAIIELLQNKNKAYDDSVIKALLYTVSLYPIGSYVFLSNRKVAMVVDSNPENPKFPIVHLLTEKEKDGSLKEMTTSPQMSILRILSKREQEDMLKLINGKNESDNTESTDTIIELESASEEEILKISQQKIQKPVQQVQKPVETLDAVESATPTKDALQKQVPKPAVKSAVEKKSEDNIEEVDISIFS